MSIREDGAIFVNLGIQDANDPGTRVTIYSLEDQAGKIMRARPRGSGLRQGGPSLGLRRGGQRDDRAAKDRRQERRPHHRSALSDRKLMATALRDYGGPLLLALLVHLAAASALHGGWLPRQERETRASKPQIVNSTLLVMQPKAKPKPKPQPAAQAPQPKPAPAQGPATPAAAHRPTRPDGGAAASGTAAPRTAGTPASPCELAQASFAQALQSEASELAQDEDEVVAQSFRFGIYQRVVANWSRPPSARNGMQARLLVELIPTGEVVGVTIVESSGNGVFDRSAEAAVRKAHTFEVPREADLFERHFRRFSLLFRPEDLLR